MVAVLKVGFGRMTRVLEYRSRVGRRALEGLVNELRSLLASRSPDGDAYLLEGARDGAHSLLPIMEILSEGDGDDLHFSVIEAEENNKPAAYVRRSTLQRLIGFDAVYGGTIEFGEMNGMPIAITDADVLQNVRPFAEFLVETLRRDFGNQEKTIVAIRVKQGKPAEETRTLRPKKPDSERPEEQKAPSSNQEEASKRNAR